MKKRFVAAVGLVVLLAAVMVGSAAAQSGCFDDVVNYQACYMNGGLQIIHIGPDNQGHEVGTLPDTLFRYAAATYESDRYVGRVTSPYDGSYAELYFSYKVPAGNAFVEYWEFTLYNAGGVALATAPFQITANPDASVTPSLGGGAAGGGQGASAGAAAPMQVITAEPVDNYEPTIVQGGSVGECLVRNTYSVRMRIAPSLNARVLDTVPFDTSMPSDLRTVDNRWYRAFFVSEGGVGRLGWISADYLEPSDACADISAVAPLDRLVPAAPSAPVSTSSGAATSGASAGAAAPVAFDPTWGGRLDLTPVEPGTVNQCLVRNTYTVRIRLAPSNSAPVMDTVPYDSSMPADLRTTDGQWIRSNYAGSLGWINTQYLDPSDACANLAGIAPIP